jgi:exosortase A-associated hydrolase 1
MNTAQLATLENAVTFLCEGQTLVGVVTTPVQAVGDLGLVIVVGGPQYRAGSHRQFVQQARSAAAAGVPTLRFDVRGMGDSEGELRSFEHITPDISAAIAALMQACPSVQRIALWGLCDGASAALLYLDETLQDQRVHGLCLLNPWVRSEASLAATHVKHYYAQRLLQPDFWTKLLRGQVAGRALKGFVRNILTMAKPAGYTDSASVPPLQHAQRMARAWSRFNGRVLLVLSGNDYTAKEFLHTWASPGWVAARSLPGLHRVDLAEADHTFSQTGSQGLLMAACATWLTELSQRAETMQTRACMLANPHE